MSTTSGSPRETQLTPTPPVNVYEGNGELTVAAPIPGAHPQHTEVVVTPDQVRLKAHGKYPQAQQHYHRHEWQVGSWQVQVDLPKHVDPARARATLNLGVLVVMAPVSDQGSGEHRPLVE
jgi:HSP20 family molecular chaperone IbpA